MVQRRGEADEGGVGVRHEVGPGQLVLGHLEQAGRKPQQALHVQQGGGGGGDGARSQGGGRGCGGFCDGDGGCV